MRTLHTFSAPKILASKSLWLRYCKEIEKFSVGTKRMGNVCIDLPILVFGFVTSLFNFFEWVNNVKDKFFQELQYVAAP
jgi:hypothetical protein